MSINIQAVSVNHNTSLYMELMLRSYFATHRQNLPLQFTIYDNASTDRSDEFSSYLQSRHIPLIQTGFSTVSKNNSHGEILRNFVVQHKNCSHFLFLDTDACFVQEETLPTMLHVCLGMGKQKFPMTCARAIQILWTLGFTVLRSREKHKSVSECSGDDWLARC